jgi:hypothetical protein
MRMMASRSMSQSVTQENALDWVKQDKRRMLHVVYRVGDLDKSIKYVVSKIELVANFICTVIFFIVKRKNLLGISDFIQSALE